MIKRLSDFIIKFTSLRVLAALVLAVIVIEIAFSMLMSDFVEATGGSILDMSAGYSAEFAYERLESFHKAADVYFKIRIIDFFFPIIYALALSVLSCLVYRKKYDTVNDFRWILFVPFLAAFFDYVENIILVILFRSLPTQYLFAASVLNVVTILKFGLIGLSILLFITGVFSLLKGSDSMLLMGNKFKGEKKDIDDK